MFKKILLSAAALSGLFLFASQAEAGYGYGYSYGYGHYKPHHRSYSYYKPHCYSVTKPVTIRVWERLFLRVLLQTIYRDYQDLQLADPGSPGAPHRLGQSGAAVLSPQGGSPSFLARISSSPPN